MLTLPLARILKEQFPYLHIAFMGKSYTKPVIECCAFVDEFIDVADFLASPLLIGGKKPEAILHVFPVQEIAERAKSLGIPWRIGTTNRLFHWTTCNKLVKLSRKNSSLHEAQLNVKLLHPFGIDKDYTLSELGESIGLQRIPELQASFKKLIDADKYNLILHPRSQGSAREWGLDNFASLIKQLPQDKYKIFISGTEKERESLDELFRETGNLTTDICGLMNLSQFIAFISQCDGLVANSTGPLHIAGAVGIRAVGIYPPIRPMHPGRWQPLGEKAAYLVEEKTCDQCRKNPAACQCMKGISSERVIKMLQ